MWPQVGDTDSAPPTCPQICFFFQAEDGIRDGHVTGVQTCALPISRKRVQVFKSHLDERYAGIYAISSHDGRTVEAIPADSAAQIGQQIDPMAHVIAIDEAQFMDEGIIALVTSLAARGRRVI